MKVMAFNARPDERAFFDHFSQSLNMDLTLQQDTLTLDNVALTRGYDGISCTCDLPAPILEKLAENGVRYVALRTIGYDNVDLKAAAVLHAAADVAHQLILKAAAVQALQDQRAQLEQNDLVHVSPSLIFHGIRWKSNLL